MIETIVAILFLLGIVLVATGPKSSNNEGKGFGCLQLANTQSP